MIATARNNDLGKKPKNFGFRCNRRWFEAVEEWAFDHRLNIQDLGIAAVAMFTGIKHPAKTTNK